MIKAGDTVRFKGDAEEFDVYLVDSTSVCISNSMGWTCLPTVTAGRVLEKVVKTYTREEAMAEIEADHDKVFELRGYGTDKDMKWVAIGIFVCFTNGEGCDRILVNKDGWTLK